MATLEAVFPTARDRLNFIEHERDEGLETHKVRQVYIAVPGEHTHKVDVTDYIETKIAALREHKSQISDIDALAERIRQRSKDPDSPEEYVRYIEYFRVITLQ